MDDKSTAQDRIENRQAMAEDPRWLSCNHDPEPLGDTDVPEEMVSDTEDPIEFTYNPPAESDDPGPLCVTCNDDAVIEKHDDFGRYYEVPCPACNGG